MLERSLGAGRLLALVAALPLLGLLGMALASGWTGLVFVLLIQVARGLSLTLFYDALNPRITGDFRATVNSLVSLAVRAVFIFTGPALGYMLDKWGVTTTLIALLLVFGPLFVVLIIGLTGRIRREREGRAASQLV